MVMQTYTATSLADLKAVATSRVSVVYDRSVWTWTAGDYSGRADDQNIVKANSTPLTTGAWIREGTEALWQRNVAGDLKEAGSFINVLPLFAANYGVKGDGSVETAAVQAFINLCNMQQRAAFFGRLPVIIDGPVNAASVPVIFESAGNGVNGRAPGLYVRGNGYTALTMSGVISGSQIYIYPDQPGAVSYNADGSVASDTRPKINGLALGIKNGSVYAPCILSFVPSITVSGLNGFGVCKTIVWDSTFASITVEDCGESGSAATSYAYHVVADNNDTCNELSVVRLQVERAVHRAIFVDPRTLSCTFSKTHSERARGIAGVSAWVLGGATVWLAVRLQSAFPVQTTANLVGPVHVIGLRGEMGLIYCDASSTRMRIESSAGSFAAFNDQNGFVTFASCAGSFYNMGAGCILKLCNADTVELGFSPPNYYAVIDGGTVADLHPRSGETQSAVRLSGVVANGTLAGVRDTLLLNGTRFTPASGTQGLGTQNVTIDASSEIAGNVTVDNTAGRWDGLIRGNVTVSGPHRWLAGYAAHATGSIINWGPPSSSGAVIGQFCKNVRPTAQGAAGSQYVVTGWAFLDGGSNFTELRSPTGV